MSNQEIQILEQWASESGYRLEIAFVDGDFVFTFYDVVDDEFDFEFTRNDVLSWLAGLKNALAAYDDMQHERHIDAGADWQEGYGK